MYKQLLCGLVTFLPGVARIGKAELSHRFAHVTDDDLTTSGDLIQALKQ